MTYLKSIPKEFKQMFDLSKIVYTIEPNPKLKDEQIAGLLNVSANGIEHYLNKNLSMNAPVIDDNFYTYHAQTPDGSYVTLHGEREGSWTQASLTIENVSGEDEGLAKKIEESLLKFHKKHPTIGSNISSISLRTAPYRNP